MNRAGWIALSAMALEAGVARGAVPLVTVYDNTTNETTFAWFNPPGASGPTGIVADDITPVAGYAEQPVTQMKFGLYNNNTTASVITPTAYFYQNNGAGGGPGTLIASDQLAPVAMAGLSTTTVTEVNPLGFFNLPATTFWVGLSFDALSSDDSNAIGQLVYYPPTTGVSADLFFVSDGPASNASNPPGTLFAAPFGGNPEMSFEWQFSVTVLPEPTAAMTLGGLAMLALSRRTRGTTRACR
jgi:hypothetical protein